MKNVICCYNCATVDHSFYASENGFDLVKCKNCGLLYVSNPPPEDEISQAHKTGQHRGEKSFNVTGLFDYSKVEAYEKILKSIYSEDFFKSNITWLDIGCGHGEFLLALKNISNNKIIAEGIEPNEYKVKSAIKKGLNVRNADLQKLQKKYDIVSFLNVYSHLPNPPETISTWKKLLNANGEFLLETGDTANLSSDIHYRPLDLPDHLSFASEEIVKNILGKSGFIVLDVKKYPTIKPTLKNISKEIIKIFIPNRTSRIKSIINHKQYSQTDMWLRAKANS